jgi:predicted SAM-dependent methyltransferase
VTATAQLAPEPACALRTPPAPPPASGARCRDRLVRLAVRLASGAGRGCVRARAAWLRRVARATIRRTRPPWLLSLGSGGAPLPGWTNVDLAGLPDLRLDLRGPLPWPDASVRLIHSEHFLEHVPLAAARALLRECRRVLRDDGVLRIAMPDLAALVRAYLGDWRAQPWVARPEHAFLDTPARMLNLAFYGWGHCHLYDEAELELRLREAGFAAVERCRLGASAHPELRGLETRADSLLVLEAHGRAPTRQPT